ncbi:Bug family tripartite tricarboxylate transporter substrate binding protein [Noviherbaspirillum saxi]|uniref:Tripartite tricarboxylate transporter substrate binding protein n=1 Tax=Noviherbaspirillum saxi TaxID=2320863 RepID=A0A3A3FIP4_9BURK|nr:tripartite tricarboxylate transporter substrate binding protein [Noviherbaspirillum saxi]RJF92258.1 tripartite tricarboxylate transporter substrate binding protein [Noviherbaspirillum saxi]
MNHSFYPKRRRLLAAAGGGLLLGTALTGFAQSTGGSGPIKIIVPFSPGTTPDLMARLLDPKLARRLGKPVIVDNKPGASGILGMDAVAKAAPDGHTLMIGTSTALTIPYFYKKIPFDVIQSFQPITMVGRTNFALVAHSSVPVANARELVAYLKKNPDKVTYGSPGKGTFHHLVMEQFAAQTATTITHVPYKGSAGMFTDLVGGHVDLAIMPLHVAAPLESAGKLKIIGATRAERDRSHPKIVTLQEAGIAAFNNDAWYAVWGPKGMSKELVTGYATALQEALGNDEVKAKLDQQGVSITPSTPEELNKIARAEYEHWGRIIKAANIQPE